MASEIPRERVLANFKPSTTERLRAKSREKRAKRSERPGNSEEHLAALRKCPCAATLTMPAGEVHHLKFGTGERGTGMRSSDRWGVPLSRAPHDEIERVGSRNEHAKFAEWGISDPLGLAAALWSASPDVKRMTAIIFAARGLKRGGL